MRKILIFTSLFFFIFFAQQSFFNYEYFKKVIEKKVHKIEVHNLNNLEKNTILKKIKLKEGHSFWSFNSSQLANELKNIKAIKNFSFKMENNGVLNIFITEDTPFMIWKFSNKIKYINEKGDILEYSKKKFKNLITLEGNLQPKTLVEFNKILINNNVLKKNISKIYYTENIGWKIFLKDQSCLYLPEKKVDKVINVYTKIINSPIYKNFKYFDMRILGRVYLNKDNKCLVS